MLLHRKPSNSDESVAWVTDGSRKRKGGPWRSSSLLRDLATRQPDEGPPHDEHPGQRQVGILFQRLDEDPQRP